MAQAVGEVKEEPLHALLKTSKEHLNLIENAGDRTSQDYKDLIIDSILTLERISVIVSALHLFSNNEDLSDLSTETVKFMLVPAYLGQCHQQHYDFPNRKTHILAAKAYYKDFLDLCTLYGINKDSSLNLNRLDNPVNNSSREEKMQKYRDIKKLEDKIKELERRVNVEEEVQREIYLSHVSLWIMRSKQEVYNINSEVQMLDHMEKIRGGLIVQKPIVRPKLMNPFILVKDELMRAVYGAGYPSLPTKTLDQFYDEELKKIVEAKNNQPEPEIEPEDPDAETEEGRAAKLRWDEYKDTHKSGWGNRHNRS